MTKLDLEPPVRLRDEPNEVARGWSASQVSEGELVDDEWVEANTTLVGDDDGVE